MSEKAKKMAMIVGSALAEMQLAGLEIVPATGEPEPTPEPPKNTRPHIGAKQIAKALKRSSRPATRSWGE